MIPKHIETIIHKYLSNEASEKDIDFLADWIKNPDNQTAFEDYVKFDATIYKTYNKFNASESYKNLIKDQKKHRGSGNLFLNMLPCLSALV